MIILEDLLKTLSNPDRLRIKRGEEEVFVGYHANFEHANGLTGQEEVERFKVATEIKHKEWKERGLLPPLEPEVTPKYSFSDLELRIYYDIFIK